MQGGVSKDLDVGPEAVREEALEFGLAWGPVALSFQK